LVVVRFVFQVLTFSKEVLPNGVQSNIVKVFGESAQHSQSLEFLSRQVANLIFLSCVHWGSTKTTAIIAKLLTFC
jgi:hypothetical protein